MVGLKHSLGSVTPKPTLVGHVLQKPLTTLTKQ